MKILRRRSQLDTNSFISLRGKFLYSCKFQIILVMINLILTYILNISYLVLTRGIGEILKKKPLRSLKGDYCKANKKKKEQILLSGYIFQQKSCRSLVKRKYT